MVQNAFASNGWGLIAAASQDALNKQLSKLPLILVKRDVPFEIFGTPITAHANVTLSPPQVKFKDGSGRQVDALLPMSGTVIMNTTPIPIPNGEVITMTTQLAQLEAKLNPHPDANQTNYDLILDLESKDIIVNIDLNIDIPSLTGMQTMLELLIRQDISNGKDYKVATFSLGKKQAEQLQPLIPVYADFPFVQDRDFPGRSNLLVLMQTSNKFKGGVYFSHPLLPPNENFMVLVSNKLLLEQAGPQALYFDVDVQADVTFLDIQVEATDKIWHQFEFTGGDKIGLKKIKEGQNQSRWMEWWKWLLAAWWGLISAILVGIINLVVAGTDANPGEAFGNLGAYSVTWPNQKYVKHKSISTPNHVVVTLDVQFA
ncbi:hypothetical protein B0T26DRAFT_783819 [Lasiosphaeria miniovina]|uniref:Uncharacterized protein n=1 Tax=Lasiosphaeria miniovina TaxID=1954250 RepID=A0AA40DUT8_9PEZI|nr:uncharacterized protein B0T26DRAFT_783819 [Lasiosphaeria miniovina]KAK0714006.1 hypothetical protein B0T26DRAFT_783819 [Lasiosphaeria miniovina]